MTIFICLFIIAAVGLIYFLYRREIGMQKTLTCSIGSDGSIKADGAEPSSFRLFCNRKTGNSWGFFYVLTVIVVAVVSAIIWIVFLFRR